MQDITEIWIINSFWGVLLPLFFRRGDGPQFIWRFFRGDPAFSKNITGEGVHNIGLENDKLVILPDKNAEIFFIGRAKQKVSDKTLKRCFELLQDLFYKKYGADFLSHWEGKLDFFENFQEDIREIFLDHTESMKNMW